MPVDAIKVGLAKVGISIKEISGRTYQLDPIDPDNITGLARVSKRSKKKTDIMQAVAEFNSGDCDALIINVAAATRSEERRVGKECVSTCRSRWSPYH